MKLKLNPVQQQKLLQAIQKENAYRQQFEVQRRQYAEATRSRMDIVEMICDAGKIDPTKYDLQNLSVKDGHLILTELKDLKPLKASDRIRRDLKTTNIKSNGHAKAKS